MPYEFGTAVSQHDLLDKLRIFLLAQGFTINMWADDVYSYYQPALSTAGKRLHASKGGFYVNFRSCVRAFPFPYYQTTSTNCGSYTRYRSEVTGIVFNMSTGFDAGRMWAAQPGGPVYSGYWYGGVLSVISGAVPSYRFFYFDNPRMLLVSVERAPGEFVHALACDLEKTGSYDGGQFFCGSCDGHLVDLYSECSVSTFESAQSAFLLNVSTFGNEYRLARGGVRIVGEDGMVPGTDNDWRPMSMAQGGANNVFSCCGPYYAALAYTSPAGYSDTLADPSEIACPATEGMILCATPSEYNAIVPPVRVPILAKRSSSNATPQWAIAGYVPHLRLIRMDQFSPGEIISYGEDHWLLLPVLRKGIGGYTIGLAVEYDAA